MEEIKDVSESVSRGRPPIYETPEEMQSKIDEYFAGGYRTRKVMVGNKRDGYEMIDVPKITITGLVIYLGFDSRQSFYDYEKKADFSYTIKRARTFIEREYEEQVDINPAGAIFALKNFGWTDKFELDHSGEIKGGSDDLKTIAAGISKLLTDEPTASKTDSETNGQSTV